jgi:hypothetical protein
VAGRVTQLVIEVDAFGTPTGRVSQVVLETAAFGTPAARASQQTVEVGGFASPGGRVSQLVLEVLVANVEVGVPVIYPSLPGIDIKVIWRPKAVNLNPQVHSSGREVRASASNYPLHEFELQYNMLRDRPTEIELKTLMGFFLSLGGSLTGFCFLNPYDNYVQGQGFITTDGVNNTFGPLMRTYGAGGYDVTEPVGYVDMTQPFNLYVDGAWVSPNDATWGYTVQQTTPVNQLVKFTNTPASGHVITVDMHYFYYCNFADDSIDFEQLLWRIWKADKIKIKSLRGP